ncbi:MAG: phytochelatin synthase family protein [Proteobacteria bacterium]|nr:phytochelatin synthase family protein [Pseudomonadota bacterium]
MLVLKYIMRGYLSLRYFFHKITRTGSFGKDRAETIPSPLTPPQNALKKALFRHHVKQFHESSCSVASVVCVVNAILETTKTLNFRPITQQQILEKVRTAHWKERMGANGYKGRRGLPLEVLSQVVAESLKAYGIRYKSTEFVRARGKKASQPIRQRLLSRLEQFETQGNCLIIAHFDQGCFIPDLNIPHISPVGGFDPVTQRVTLLDVDPSLPLPYDVSFDTFYKGISTNYNHVFKPFGYGRGGYVYIQL